MDNTTQAYIATKKFAAEYKANYIAKATPAQRNSKHFDIGYGMYWGEEEHIALLATFGFKDVEEFEEAIKTTDWMIAYDKFQAIQRMLKHKSPESIALWAGIKEAGFYDEEDHNIDGPALLAIAQKVAPKYAQLIELTTELGLKVPYNWSN